MFSADGNQHSQSAYFLFFYAFSSLCLCMSSSLVSLRFALSLPSLRLCAEDGKEEEENSQNEPGGAVFKPLLKSGTHTNIPFSPLLEEDPNKDEEKEGLTRNDDFGTAKGLLLLLMMLKKDLFLSSSCPHSLTHFEVSLYIHIGLDNPRFFSRFQLKARPFIERISISQS